MNGFPSDCIAIDTNVFGHLTNKSKNADKHINNLLIHFMNQKTSLLVDENGNILKEYDRHLNRPEFRERFEGKNEAYILYYWMHPDIRKKVTVMNDNLRAAILNTIPEEQEEADRIFVYIAFVKGRILISNDDKHIIRRRDELRDVTRNLCPKGGDVMSSRTAINQMRLKHND